MDFKPRLSLEKKGENNTGQGKVRVRTCLSDPFVEIKELAKETKD